MVKTFWNNEGLRGSLFRVKPINDSDQKLKADSQNNFNEWVEDKEKLLIDSKFYSFIEIKSN